MRDYLANNKGDRHGKFRYSTTLLTDIGEDLDALHEEFRPFRERFGVEVGEPGLACIPGSACTRSRSSTRARRRSSIPPAPFEATIMNTSSDICSPSDSGVPRHQRRTATPSSGRSPCRRG